MCHGTKPIHLIVSGQGGTGKSRVINMLQQLVSNDSTELLVVVAAPTGLVAYSIAGTTIHKTFSLPAYQLSMASPLTTGPCTKIS